MTDKNVKNSVEGDVKTHAPERHERDMGDKSHLPKDVLEDQKGRLGSEHAKKKGSG